MRRGRRRPPPPARVGTTASPVALCFVDTTIRAVIAAVPAWRITRSPRSVSEIRWNTSSGPSRNTKLPSTDGEHHQPGHDPDLRSLASPAAHPADDRDQQAGSGRPTGREQRRRRRRRRSPIVRRRPQPGADQSEQAQRDDDLEVEPVEAGAQQCPDRDRARPPDAEREAGRDEVAALLRADRGIARRAVRRLPTWGR